ncbi:MAG: YitT family protein [Oscillospiraceae bacterium]|nr:YitT family protein [Oscillospiraceae bacterium]
MKLWSDCFMKEISKKELFKRYILFIISLFFSALGVAFSKHAELGVSPISSVANVLSCQFTAFSLGTWLIIWNCILILGQIVLLRKNFKLIQLLQIPLSFVFGWFTDLGMWIVNPIPVNSYPTQLLLVLIGIFIMGFGIALSVIADVILNSGEAFVKAISDTFRKEFSNIKIGFDISCVILALELSLLFFDFRIVGTREGTVLAAILTGLVVKFFTKRFSAPLNFILKK